MCTRGLTDLNSSRVHVARDLRLTAGIHSGYTGILLHVSRLHQICANTDAEQLPLSTSNPVPVHSPLIGNEICAGRDRDALHL